MEKKFKRFFLSFVRNANSHINQSSTVGARWAKWRTKKMMVMNKKKKKKYRQKKNERAEYA